MTCNEMAEKLGYTREHLSAVENELTPFSRKLKLRIKQVFRVEL